MGCEWLELLKQIAPNMTDAAVLWGPDRPLSRALANSPSSSPWPRRWVLNFVQSTFVMPPRSSVASPAFGHLPNGGMIVTASALAIIHRNLIVGLAARTSCLRSIFRRCSSLRGPLILIRAGRLKMFWISHFGREANGIEFAA
jgi:hypothetical protein